MNIQVKVWERKLDVDHGEDEPKFQADIFVDGRDYHALANHPLVALVRAARYAAFREVPLAYREGE